MSVCVCVHVSHRVTHTHTKGLTCLWFVWGWWWCPHWACYFPLHTPPYSFFSQEIWALTLRGKEHRIFLHFCNRTTKFFFSFMNWLLFMSRLALLGWRPFLVNLVNIVWTRCVCFNDIKPGRKSSKISLSSSSWRALNILQKTVAKRWSMK
jgi:hypothetical protein